MATPTRAIEARRLKVTPDRLDALVWAVTELSQRAARPGPRIRGLWDPPLVPRWG